jgi:hypothetical protein
MSMNDEITRVYRLVESIDDDDLWELAEELESDLYMGNYESAEEAAQANSPDYPGASKKLEDMIDFIHERKIAQLEEERRWY